MPNRSSPRRSAYLLQSAGAIMAGLVVIVAVSLAADSLLHWAGVYPPWGEPMHEPELNAIALAYRAVIAALGGYIAARLAPRAPLAHALILGGVCFVLGGLGAIGAWDMSPAWYLILVALTGPPFAFAGGWFAATHRQPDD